jgi:hypothetical protein
MKSNIEKRRKAMVKDKAAAFGIVFNCYQMLNQDKQEVLFDLGDPIELIGSVHGSLLDVPE